jgi:hypothetical protein
MLTTTGQARNQGEKLSFYLSSPITVPSNNALHQTGRGGAAVSLCRRPVVEARPAGERECCTERGTDRRPHRASGSPRSRMHLVADEVKRPSICGVGQVSLRLRPSVGVRPNIFQHHVGPLHDPTFPSTASWLDMSAKSARSGFPVGTPRLGGTRPHNNGLHQTGRGGAADFLRRRPVIEARPAGEPECCTGPRGAISEAAVR